MLVDERIRSGNAVVDGYIAQLEAEVVSFGSKNTRKLLRSIDAMAGKLSETMDLIASDQKDFEGKEVELSNKLVNVFLQMVKDADKIKGFADLVDSLDDTTVETVSKTETTVKKRTANKNIFEEIQSSMKANA